jgi:serine/threonine protein kinase
MIAQNPLPNFSKGLLVARTIKIYVEEGINALQSFTLKENELLIVGRGSQSDTKLDDPVMSRKHFSLASENGKFLVEDLQSSTGTFVNGYRISKQAELHGSDELIAGNTKFSVSITGGSDAETVLPPKTRVWAELSGLSGANMGDYVLNKIIGSGQSGLVYEAYNEKKDRHAAVKVFSKTYTQDAEQRERFVRGMQAFSKIRHPHFIRLYKAGKSASHCYAAMELIEGENLSSVISRIGIQGMLDWKEVWRCARHVGSALMAAYDHEVIHRNLVPCNIIRRTEDKAYLLGDFTLAKPIDPSIPNVTQADQVLGDILYLPPERIDDATTTDTRSDIYGLGATCYALLTGKPPAFGNGLSEVLSSIRNDVPELPSSFCMSVNSHLESAVMQMIAKDPAQRFQTPHQMVNELDRIGKLNGLAAGL